MLFLKEEKAKCYFSKNIWEMLFLKEDGNTLPQNP